MSNAPANRQPQGIKTGGQFAPSPHDEADPSVTLDSAPRWDGPKFSTIGEHAAASERPPHLSAIVEAAKKSVEDIVDVSGIDWTGPAVDVHDELVERYLAVFPEAEQDEMTHERAQRFAERTTLRRLQ